MCLWLYVAQLPPEMDGPALVNVTVGEQIMFRVHATDSNGDNVTLHARHPPHNSSLQQDTATSAIFMWTPFSLDPIDLR